ncbi:MAG: hypothetical protein H7138_22250 [Myxococcales bacterium]|nr:hypothetical protein [Myxococcales bacterium]
MKETSARIHGTPTQVANPVITVDTMPSTLEPSGNNTNANAGAQANPVVVAPGVVTGPAPVGTTTTGSTGTAGPNGPGTGNTTTPTGPATGAIVRPPPRC